MNGPPATGEYRRRLDRPLRRMLRSRGVRSFLAVLIMSKSRNAFIQLPEALLVWQPADESKHLSLADKAVWSAIADRIRNIGDKFGVQLVAEVLGCEKKTVLRSIPRLEAAGILRVTRAAKAVVGCGREIPLGSTREDRRNCYSVSNIPSNDPKKGPFTVPARDRLRYHKGTVGCPREGPFTVPQRDRRGSQGGTVNGPREGPCTEHTKTDTNNNTTTVADFDPNKSKVVELLTKAGIWPKAAAELAAGGLTVPEARAALALAERARVSNRPGYIVDLLRRKPPEFQRQLANGEKETVRRREIQRERARIAQFRKEIATIPTERHAEVVDRMQVFVNALEFAYPVKVANQLGIAGLAEPERLPPGLLGYAAQAWRELQAEEGIP